jgi:hypothetical protein
MSNYHDRLGGVIIPDFLLDKVKEYVPPVPTNIPEPVVIDGPADWTLVKTFNSSKGNSVHRVEQKGQELRCTCQGFRIQKRGFCKHTEQVKKELGL